MRAQLPRRALVICFLLVLALAAPAQAATPFLAEAPACPVFPSSNVWNRRVDALPVRADSEALTASIGLRDHLHPDFSSIHGGNYGIPYNVVGRRAARHQVSFTYASESDAGPYPIPADPLIERQRPTPSGRGSARLPSL